MQFGPLPLQDAIGKVLAHNLSGPDGTRLLSKGRSLTSNDIETLRNHGFSHVYVAWLDPGDIDENTAALRTAQLISGDNIELSRASVGRVNLRATKVGVLRIDGVRLDAINQQEGITVATLPAHAVVQPRKIIATVKIIPFGIPSSAIEAVADLMASEEPILRLDALSARPVGLVLYGSSGLQERLTSDFKSLVNRVNALESEVIHTDFVEMDTGNVEQRLAESLNRMCREGVALILMAGETAVMHRNDMIPRAVEQAGGQIECVGAPVEPGNLMMLAYLGDLPILSAPGCSRSPKANVVDQIIPRLLVGEHLTRSHIIALAHGGLLAG